MSNKDEIVLKISGKTFSGWKTIEISHSINKLCPTFAMEYTEEYPNSIDDSTFKMGQECLVEINDNRLITGYIEEIEDSDDYQSRNLQLRGRDKLCDLIDCSNWQASSPKNEFINQTVYSIIKTLCSPFGISVEVDNTALSPSREKPKSPWKTKEGDTIFESILQLCNSHAILPIGYGDGKLTLTRTSSKKAFTKLKRGQNILSARMALSNIERYSNYIVKATGITTDDFADVNTKIRSFGRADDEMITRHRPLILILDDVPDSKAQLNNKALWEASTRSGFSRKYEYKVNDWLQEDGTTWSINSLVYLDDPIKKVNGEFLITDISYRLDSTEGKITTLALMHPDAFKLIKMGKKNSTKYDITDLIKK